MSAQLFKKGSRSHDLEELSWPLIGVEDGLYDLRNSSSIESIVSKAGLMESDLIPNSVAARDTVKVVKKNKGWSKYHITIEPIKIALGFTIAFTSGVTIDLLQRNVCHQKFNLTYAECLGNMSTDTKVHVEEMTADVNMMNNMIQGFCPLFLVLFIGPWSDMNGRKPFIIIPLMGYAFYYLLWGIFSFFPNIPVIYYFLPSLPLGFTGGAVALYVCTWSYTCDNFVSEERTLRFTVSGTCSVAGSLLGNALAAQVVRLGGHYGFQIVFLISFAAALFTVVYTIFALEETVIRKGKMTNLIDFGNVKSTFIVMLIRPEKGVLLSALVLITLLAEVPTGAGEESIVYLVGKSQYNWDLNTFNMFTALSSLLSTVFPLLSVWLMMGVLEMANDSVLIMSTVIMFITNLLKALSVNEVMYWIARNSAVLASLVGATIDTELSNIVSDNDQGKAFTMTSICDALTPLVSVPLYTEVYKMLLPDKTLYTFFVTVIFATIAILSSIGLSLRKRSIAYKRASTVIND